MYQMMQQEFDADEIAVAGDSAGGGIALVLCMHVRNQGLPQPNNLILLSPVVDILIAHTAEESAFLQMMTDNGVPTIDFKNQPIIETWWRGPFESTHYFVNPIHGDLRGLAPISVFVGSGESILTWQLAAKAVKQRVRMNYWEKLNAPHTWITRDDLDNQEEHTYIVDLLTNPPS